MRVCSKAWAWKELAPCDFQTAWWSRSRFANGPLRSDIASRSLLSRRVNLVFEGALPALLPEFELGREMGPSARREDSSRYDAPYLWFARVGRRDVGEILSPLGPPMALIS